MEDISISLSENNPARTSEVRIDGVIDTTTAGELEQVVNSLIGREQYRMVFDLAGVEYISSAGWGIFISHIKEVRESDGDIKLAGMVPNVREIFELLEFDKVLRAYESVDAARQDFQPGAPTTKKKADK